MSGRCDRCGYKTDRILLLEVDLTDTVIRLCEACAEVLADGLIRGLYRMERELNRGI